jgi:DNA helicase-2/ATP-dependent DNA helicase PcrA
MIEYETGTDKYDDGHTYEFSNGYPPSPQQSTALDWVRNGTGNGLWVAVAGSGKTTTLMEAAKLMGGYISIVAYNRAIADEIKVRINEMGKQEGQNIQVGTVHSFGLRSWKRCAPQCKVEGPIKDGGDPRYQNAGYMKFDRIEAVLNDEDQVDGYTPTEPLTRRYRWFVKKLMSMAKQYGIGLIKPDKYDNWLYLVERFGMDDDLSDDAYEFEDGGRDNMVRTGIEYARRALEVSNLLAYEVMDHDDMIYLALMSRCRVFGVNFILSDECQDQNPARIALIRKMMAKGARAIFVGDPHQAIYGFTGADSDAITNIAKEFNCATLPLTHSFRCPVSVVEEARKYVSHIEPTPTAPNGTVMKMTDLEFAKMTGFMDTDVILCRNNAPLVAMAYDMIRRGIACYVEGRDIGSGIQELAERWKMSRLDAIKERAIAYRSKQIKYLIGIGKENQAATVADKVDTLLALIQGMPPDSSVKDLTQRIKTMFQDSDGNRKKCLTLSSVHKSKGREWPRVFILGMNIYMPSPYAKQDWQKQQEDNLCYVAITRSMNTLVYIDVTRKPR